MNFRVAANISSIFIFFVLFQGTACAEISDERMKVIKACVDQARVCSAQCEGLSSRLDQVEKGFFSDTKTSPRGRCKAVCEEPCDRYKPEMSIEVIEQLTK
jgi:predicted PP-loop superfamily ATPase